MPKVNNGNYAIYYEITENNDGPPLILIAGLGEQIGAVEYPVEQCRAFAEAGFSVIRIDNRECGLSVPAKGEPDSEYSLLDMADDVAAVIEDLGDSPAHVLGASLGGYIARWLAIRHPQLVSSLTVVMSGSGADPTDEGPQIDPAVREKNTQILNRLPRDEAIDSGVKYWQWLWGNGYPFPERFVRERLTQSFDRAYRPEGLIRQLYAAVATTGLWEAQTRISIPTLVVHGGEDPYFPVAHGEAIAKRIPRAELWLDPRMGHIMHPEQWQTLASKVAALASIPQA